MGKANHRAATSRQTPVSDVPEATRGALGGSTAPLHGREEAAGAGAAGERSFLLNLNEIQAALAYAATLPPVERRRVLEIAGADLVRLLEQST